MREVARLGVCCAVVCLLQQATHQPGKSFRLLLRPFEQMWRDKDMRIDHRRESFRWPTFLFWYSLFL